MKRLPPHIAWPLGIVGLLLLGITWSLGVVIASRSDGGPEVVENYYEKAISWDQEIKRRAQSDAQNWNLSLGLQEGSTAPQLTLRVLDAEGLPVEGLNGLIYAFRPQKSQHISEMPLIPSESLAGSYYFAISGIIQRPMDFRIDAEKDSLIVYTTIRKEF